MKKIDKSIITICETIDDNISSFSNNRGLLSQNILSQLRNLVEDIAIKIYSNGKDVDPKDFNGVRSTAIKFIKSNNQYKFLSDFYKLLKISVSHYTNEKEASERLMLKYYEYILKSKRFLKEHYNLNVINNLNKFPLNTDSDLLDFHTKISKKIDSKSCSKNKINYTDRYYIQKIKPLFIDYKIYYEVTFVTAYSSNSKFNRIIAYTNLDIPENYSVKLSLYKDNIDTIDTIVPIYIITNYEISIRPCELNNFSKIFNLHLNIKSKSKEYCNLMNFLTNSNILLNELVSLDKKQYKFYKEKIFKSEISILSTLLDSCRDIIVNKYPGTNILLYLLNKMNNKIIKEQISSSSCKKLSNLFLKYGTIPFDKMPYCSSLVHHNPRLKDVYNSIPKETHEHELLARILITNSETHGKLFTHVDELNDFKNIDSLISKYNGSLYYKHKFRSIIKFKDYIYISTYLNNTIKIINSIKNLTKKGIIQYSESVDSWLRDSNYIIDDEYKKEALKCMFSQSSVSIIYGAAGTGKSTFIKHISNFWSNKNKLFIANTHPAVENMRRKITTKNCDFMTISKYLHSLGSSDCDILFIDECSTVSNSDMVSILEKKGFKLLVLVGDVHQIESIRFGNWFNLIEKFMPNEILFNLTTPYRTTDDKLKKVWTSVREINSEILESMIDNENVESLNNSIFEKKYNDEIVLCLNYDGFYGINNINKVLQTQNPNDSVMWEMNSYKVNDPILFNETNRFSPLIHNNTKGIIRKISTKNNKITFDIELDFSINELDIFGYELQLKGVSELGNSIISFDIKKVASTDEDDTIMSVVPFQVSYAISIHKAQGLEYDSVKIIITKESEERITHSIFYTAITRAKEKLKIYWSPETEGYILNNLEHKNINRDYNLLSSYIKLSGNK
ncbi:helicase [Dolosigranulum pigrum]|uniref:ATP-dependent DNA helicase n=1 Tax=Dolosigranulum pigrum TaxID=29394 RepID=UPI000DC03FB7|nr:ATP-dependent RecD-like DNA helicase [Dolosigranulum pigrum]QTJ34768.1 helicase [Dolosigranulum pigrum]RAN50922.1 helicase [Dolosigranulum pigrum]